MIQRGEILRSIGWRAALLFAGRVIAVDELRMLGEGDGAANGCIRSEGT